MNMGDTQPHSRNRLLATIGYQAQQDFAYALEGSIFSAGATMQWLRDGLRLIKTSAESEAIAAALPDNGGVYLVPAFAGLGAPQWNAEARGTIIGLTRDSRLDHIVRAGLEAVAYQTADLLDALRADGAPAIKSLLIDGGLTANAWAMQSLADICDVEVARPKFQEVTALGAAKLAALGAGLIASLDGAGAITGARWSPRMTQGVRDDAKAGWRKAVAAALAAAN
jgi:glycerol kinase